MHAHFAAQKAISIEAFYQQHSGFQTRLVAVEKIKCAHLKAMALAPMIIHAEQHLCPILRLRAPCTRMEGKDGVFGIKFAAEKGCQRLGFDLLFHRFYTLLALWQEIQVALFIGQFDHNKRVVKIRFQRFIGRNSVF